MACAECGNMIEVRGLVKSYGDVHAVRGIDLTVAKGQLFAFLGLNGAGKSTTINIICTLLAKDGGTVRVAGFDVDTEPERVRSRLGVVFQNSVLDAALTVREILRSAPVCTAWTAGRPGAESANCRTCSGWESCSAGGTADCRAGSGAGRT